MGQAGSVSRPPRRAARVPPAADPVVARWLRHTLADDPPRAQSLIVTVWGDALAPHGGAIWLAALIELLAPFDINERLTRTSVFRLARDGWLASQSVGRRSRYHLTPPGRQRFEAAYRRIYAAPADGWSGEWDMVVDPPANGDAEARQRRRDELAWAGFGTLAPGCFVRPRTPAAAALPALGDDAVLVTVKEAEPPHAPLAGRVEALWPLDDVAAGYRRFLALFGRVIERFRMRDIDDADPAQCFAVRTLLIHAFRRVLLRDPRLPASLLPLDWPGAAAYTLTRDFYRLTIAQAEAHLAALYARHDDALPPAEPSFHARFGGLRTAAAGR